MVIFIIVWSIWFISEILLNRFLRSGKKIKNNQDKGTIRIIWVTIGIANSLGIIFAIFLRASICNNLIIPFAGLFLIVLGMIFRFISIWTLGRFFTVDIAIRYEHSIKKDGVYLIIRHPSYLGSILSFIGFGISLNNWISLLVICIPVLIAILNRINIEERFLIDQFKGEYLDYMKKTYRLLPWIY
jgi:protein-S-isoprenylcysteine O-methyltransferase Ste14